MLIGQVSQRLQNCSLLHGIPFSAPLMIPLVIAEMADWPNVACRVLAASRLVDWSEVVNL
jgi:hypothetical protein